MHAKSFIRTSLRIATLTALGPLLAGAEGFRNPPAGSFNLGRAGGRVAHVDDATAAGQNPANMAFMEEPSINVSPGIVYIQVERSTGGVKDSNTRDPWKMLPSFFAVVPLKDQKLSLGIAVTAPYGLSNEWEKSGAFADQNTAGFLAGNPTSVRYATAYFTELKTINFNPSVGYKINEHLAVGAGLDVFYSELTLKQFLPGVFFGQPTDPTLKGKGDGFGVGGNVSLTWKIDDRQTVAFTYRSPVDVDYSGTSSVTDSGIRGDFKSKIKYPTIVSAGYGLQVTDRLRLETDVEWLEFSRFDELPITAVVVGNKSIRQSWHNGFTAGIAGDYKLCKAWTAMAGYQFYKSPVPDYTFSPTIPDGNQQVFTTGLRYHKGHHTFDAAYGGIFYDDRHITQNQTAAFAGDYKMLVHLFSMGYSYGY